MTDKYLLNGNAANGFTKFKFLLPRKNFKLLCSGSTREKKSMKLQGSGVFLTLAVI